MAGKQVSASVFMVRELRRARVAAGLTQKETGKAVNYSGSQVSAIETAQRPPRKEYLARPARV